MKQFAFDECLNSKWLARTCASMGLCEIERYPDEMKGSKDPAMLPVMLSGNASLVTMDHRIVELHRASIPVDNSGIIIVRLRRPSKMMTDRIAGRILSRFKHLFPNWAEQSWRGLCLEITEADVILTSISGRTEERLVLSLDDPDFAVNLEAALDRWRPLLIA